MKPTIMEELVQEALAKEAHDTVVPDVDQAWAQLAVRLSQEERRRYRWPRMGILVAGLAAGLLCSLLPPVQYAQQHLLGAISTFYQPLKAESTANPIITPPYAKTEPGSDSSLASRNGAQTPSAEQPQAQLPAETSAQAPAAPSGDTSQATGTGGEQVITLADLKSIVPYPIPLPNYLPSDMKLERITYRKVEPSWVVLTLYYRGAEHSLTIKQSVPGDDAAAAKVKRTRIGNSDATVLAQKGGVTIMWVKNSLKIELHTNLGEKEALQIAQSVAPTS